MTDYKQLCGELLNRLNGLYEEVIDAGVGCVPDEAQDLMNRAWDAMAKPESEGPTTQELKTFACEWWNKFGFVKDKATCRWVLDEIDPEHFADFARDVLARWGRPAPQPVPVSDETKRKND